MLTGVGTSGQSDIFLMSRWAPKRRYLGLSAYGREESLAALVEPLWQSRLSVPGWEQHSTSSSTRLRELPSIASPLERGLSGFGTASRGRWRSG